MQSALPLQFLSSIERLEHLLGVHYVVVPKTTIELLGKGGSRRFICSVNDKTSWHCGLVALNQGDYYITVSNQRMKELGIKHGDKVKVVLSEDDSEFGMEMPEELFELLQQDEEGSRRFYLLRPGFQRYIIHYVAGVKNPALKLERAIMLIGNLKMLQPGKEQFRELLGKPPLEK